MATGSVESKPASSRASDLTRTRARSEFILELPPSFRPPRSGDGGCASAALTLESRFDAIPSPFGLWRPPYLPGGAARRSPTLSGAPFRFPSGAAPGMRRALGPLDRLLPLLSVVRGLHVHHSSGVGCCGFLLGVRRLGSERRRLRCGIGLWVE